MPPSSRLPETRIDSSHMLPPHVGVKQKRKRGPIIAITIIIILLLFGALYFWGAHLNQESVQAMR